MSLERVFALARARSLVPLPFVGTVGSRASARWLQAGATHALGDFIGAGLPRQADLLVVVGEVSHKAAPTLQRLYARMADPSYVLWVKAHDDRARGAGYTTVPSVTDLVPVDVVIEGDPPTADGVDAGLALLRERVRTRRGQP
jgi:NADH:ubiquinone oxidoreductase subunit B-like Fe-S oxidoreductase